MHVHHVEFNDRAFRDALGLFATGIAIVTAEVDGVLIGTTVSSFNSVSLSPPLILFSIARTAMSFSLWQKATGFGVTLLGDDQSELSTRFATRGTDKWGDVRVRRGSKGHPLMPAGIAGFECETYARYEGGDHEILVGRVVSFETVQRDPLLFYGGRYRRLQPDQPMVTPPEVNAWLHGW
jgi:flavin reductase (DIM6/NTAB) family NADH-FMN oxidoreductase RutF